LGRSKNNKNLAYAGSPEKREAILAALARATGDSLSSNGSNGECNDEIHGYYTFTIEELAALVNGDMEKIENWVSHLDQHRATWLFNWLINDR
jgi:hypothetical protein